MKKWCVITLITGLLSVLWALPVLASSAGAETGVAIDTGNVASGYVTISLTNFEGKDLIGLVDKGDIRYQYYLIKSSSNVILQSGAGAYTITVAEGVGGGRARPIATETVNVTAVDESAMYTASNPYMEYSVSTKAIPAYRQMTEGLQTDLDKVTAVHQDLISTFAYDNDMAAQVNAGQVTRYVPVIDEVYDAKKAICYGYSAVFGGALRSQGIPTRMVHGFVPEQPNVLHAWNEVLIDGKWLAIDTTFDQPMFAAGQEVVMVRDRSNATVTKTY